MPHLVFLTDAVEEEPRKSPRRSKHTEEEGAKSRSRSLRINNNNIQNIGSLKSVLDEKFENPANIAWIDLSFNELQKVDPVSIDHVRQKHCKAYITTSSYDMQF